MSAPTPTPEPAPRGPRLTPVGGLFEQTCEVAPGDTARVQRRTRTADGFQYVGLAVHEAGRQNTVALSPEKARRIAAALLNAADEIDGTVPLVFLPAAAR